MHRAQLPRAVGHCCHFQAPFSPLWVRLGRIFLQPQCSLQKGSIQLRGHGASTGGMLMLGAQHWAGMGGFGEAQLRMGAQ